VTRAWLMVLLVGATTAAIKGAGPVFLGGRPLPGPLVPVLSLLAPALFGALSVTQTFAAGQHLTVDARVAGLLAAMAGASLRLPAIVVVVSSAAATAALRLVV
jgi:Branched-chain amino acid transport protein (AzlD)